jgi:hypothetical protein
MITQRTTAEYWIDRCYERPVEERATGCWFMDQDEYDNMLLFAFENSLPWPEDGPPLLLGYRVYVR